MRVGDIVVGQDGDKVYTAKDYLRASTSAIIEYDEDTSINFRAHTINSGEARYDYSILLIPD